MGIFFDGHTAFPWTVLGVHIAAAIAILVWSMFWSTLLFGALKYFKMLRVSTEMEFKGMVLVDVLVHSSLWGSQVLQDAPGLHRDGVQGDGLGQARGGSVPCRGLGGVPVQQDREGKGR